MWRLVHHARSHHEGHGLHHADILERIAWDGDQVGDLACFEAAQFIVYAQQLRALNGGGLQVNDKAVSRPSSYSPTATAAAENSDQPSTTSVKKLN